MPNLKTCDPCSGENKNVHKSRNSKSVHTAHVTPIFQIKVPPAAR